MKKLSLALGIIAGLLIGGVAHAVPITPPTGGGTGIGTSSAANNGLCLTQTAVFTYGFAPCGSGGGTVGPSTSTYIAVFNASGTIIGYSAGTYVSSTDSWNLSNLYLSGSLNVGSGTITWNGGNSSLNTAQTFIDTQDICASNCAIHLGNNGSLSLSNNIGNLQTPAIDFNSIANDLGIGASSSNQSVQFIAHNSGNGLVMANYTNSGFAIGTSTTARSTLDVVGNSQFSQTSTFNGNVVLNISGTQCLHSVSGLVSGTGSDCGSGGSTSLTSTQIGFGSPSNLVTGTSSLTYTTGTITLGAKASGTIGPVLNLNNNNDGAGDQGVITAYDGGSGTPIRGALLYTLSNVGQATWSFLSGNATSVSNLTPELTILSNDQSGFVGVGTSTPATKLDVNGDITDEALKSATCTGTNGTGKFISFNCISSSTANTLYLQIANNLSDLTNTSSARTNIGYSGVAPISITSTGTILFTNPGYITTSTYNASITIATAAPLGGGGSLTNGGTLNLTCSTCGPGTITTSSAGTTNSLPIWTSASAQGNSTLSQPGGGVTAVGGVAFLDGAGDFIGPNIFINGANSVISQNPTGTTAVGNFIQSGGVQLITTSTKLSANLFCSGGLFVVASTTATTTITIPDRATIAMGNCSSSIYSSGFSEQMIVNSSTFNVTQNSSGTNGINFLYSPGTPTVLAPGQTWVVIGQFVNTSTIQGATATGTVLNIYATLMQTSTITSALVLANSVGGYTSYAGSSNPCSANQAPTTISALGALGGCTSTFLTSAITSINGNSTAAQTFTGGAGISVASASGNTTTTNTGVVSLTGAGCITNGGSSTGTITLGVTCGTGTVVTSTAVTAGYYPFWGSTTGLTGTSSIQAVGGGANTSTVVIGNLSVGTTTTSTATLSVNGSTTMTSLTVTGITNAIHVGGSGGTVIAYAGSTCGGSQFANGVSATGTVNCANPTGVSGVTGNGTSTQVTYFNSSTTVTSDPGLTYATSGQYNLQVQDINSNNLILATSSGVTILNGVSSGTLMVTGITTLQAALTQSGGLVSLASTTVSGNFSTTSTVPTAVCATGGVTVAAGSTNNAGQIQNTSSTANCTITFSQAYKNTSFCTVSIATTTRLATIIASWEFASSSATGLQIIGEGTSTAANLATSTKTNYICSGN